MPKKTAKGNGWANRIEYRCTGRLRRQWRRHRYDESNLEVAKLQVVLYLLRTGTYVTSFRPPPRPASCRCVACCSPRAATSLPMPLASSFQFPDLRPPRFHHHTLRPSRPERTAADKTSNSQGSILFFIGVKTPPPHTDRNKSCPFPEEEIPPACAASRRYRPWDCVSWTSTLFSKRLAPPCFGDLLPWSSQLE